MSLIGDKTKVLSVYGHSFVAEGVAEQEPFPGDVPPQVNAHRDESNAGNIAAHQCYIHLKEENHHTSGGHTTALEAQIVETAFLIKSRRTTHEEAARNVTQIQLSNSTS